MNSTRETSGQRAQRWPTKPSGWKSYLPYFFSAAVLLVLIAYLCRNADQYQQLLVFSINSLLLLLGLRLLFFWANGLTNYVFYRGLSVPLSLNESLGLAAVNALANQLPFAGGLIAKGLYLKRRHKLAYARFLSATLVLYICFIAANGVVGVAVLGFWALADGMAVPTPLVLGFSVMTASILALRLPIHGYSVGRGRWGRLLLQLTDGWRILSEDWLLAVRLVGLQMLLTLLFAGRLWVVFRALSQDVTPVQCVLFSAATILTRLISFAPGGLGVREAIVASVAFALGFDFGVSVVAVGIDRLIATLVTAVLGTVYTYVLTRRLQKPSAGSGPDA